MNLLRIEKLPEDIYSRAKSGARYFGDSLVLQVPYQTLLCVILPLAYAANCCCTSLQS